MTLKEKVKTYSFWISLVSALLILAKTIAEYFGKTINNNLLLSIATGVCGVMVIIGLLSGPKNKNITLEELAKETQEINRQASQIVNTVKEDISANMEMTIEEQLEYLKNLKVNKQEDNQDISAKQHEKVDEQELSIKDESVNSQPDAVEVNFEDKDVKIANDEPTQNQEQLLEQKVEEFDENIQIQSDLTNKQSDNALMREDFIKYFCNQNFSKEELKEILALLLEKLDLA